jgi:hypothetical protein
MYAICSGLDPHTLFLRFPWGPNPTTCAFAASGGSALLAAPICSVRQTVDL